MTKSRIQSRNRIPEKRKGKIPERILPAAVLRIRKRIKTVPEKMTVRMVL